MTKMQAVFAATLIADILSDRTKLDAKFHEETRRKFGSMGEEALRGAVRALETEFGFSASDE